MIQSLIIHPTKSNKMNQNNQNECVAKISVQYTMNDFIVNFKSLLSLLNGDNVVLCGTQALKLHGLKMNRNSDEIDVAIYNPTEKQLEVLHNIQSFKIDNPFAPPYEGKDIVHLKSIKFKRNDMFIDILIAKPEQIMRNDLLVYKCEDMEFKIQHIGANIDAKKSYFIEHGGFSLYSRNKDVIDLQDLKNSNFNF